MSHPTILLIDFDSSSIQHARSSLTQAGYHVEVARDGVSGLAAFERLKPDLVLIEAMLPKKHGFEVCQEIKKTPYGKCTPILITSSEALGVKYVEDALQLYGCDEYVEKPVSDEELVGVCQRLLPEVVVSPLSVDPNPESQRLDDLSEDELMQRLDELIDRATQPESEPSAQGSPDETVGTSADDTDRRPLGEVDLVSFCERVFPHADSEAIPEAAKTEPQAPPPAREQSAARLLDEEEVMGQLDALARNDPAGGKLVQGHSPIEFEVSAAVESLIDLTSASSRSTRWTVERRSKLVWRTGIAGGVLVAVGLLLLAVARGRIPVEAANPPDFALAGPLATPPVSMEASARLSRGNGPSALWDATPVDPAPAGSRGEAPKPAPRRTAASTQKLRPETEVDARPAPAVTLPQALDPAPVSAAPDPTAVETNEADSVSPVLFSEPTGVESSETFGAPEASLFGFSINVDTPTSSVAGGGAAGACGMLAAFQPGSAANPPATEPAPAVGTRKGDLVPIESVDTQPILLEQPLPVYDEQSRRMRRQGTVVLKALIDERGAIGEVQLVDGIPRSRLNDAAVEAVRRWRYRAATKDGVPVKVWKTISLQFKP